MVIKKILITFLLFSQVVYADGPVQYLDKLTPAPYAGYLFTPEKEKEVRFKLVERDYYETLTTSLTSINSKQEALLKLQDDRINLYTQQVDNLSKRLAESKDSNFWSNAGFFILGALVTTGIAFSVTRATR